jgi:hypothetical protein
VHLNGAAAFPVLLLLPPYLHRRRRPFAAVKQRTRVNAQTARVTTVPSVVVLHPSRAAAVRCDV